MDHSALADVVASILCLERCRTHVQTGAAALSTIKADVSGMERTLAAIEDSLANLYRLRTALSQRREA
ncbi:MAG: hypothetical protein K2X00_21025 [Nitrospiraceae bacterium]|nr:hypothetical protein [Nitrospiraceae bacterium]